MRRIAKIAFLFAGAVLFVSACDRAFEPSGPQATPATRASLIDDGAHGDNPDFFFLPPIARRTRAADPFDGSQKPVVEICLWQNGACKKVVSRLTDVKVRGSSDEDDHDVDDDEEITERERRGFYSVRWRTRGLNLDPAKTYRIRVLVAGTELGVADVDVVRNAKEKKGVDRSRFVPLVAGKNLKIRFRLEKGAVTVRGAAGGLIVAQGGRVQLDIPAGALSRDVGFIVASTTGPAQPGEFVVPGATYDFGPDGLRFNQPVQLTLRYDQAALPPGVDERRLRLWHLAGGRWEPVPGSRVDVAANTVTGFITGFSSYGIVTWNGPEPTFQGFGTATVDGVLSAGEWDHAANVGFIITLPTGDTAQATLFIMNDQTNLYFALQIFEVDNGGLPDTWLHDFEIDFDNNHDGLLQPTEDVLRALARLAAPPAVVPPVLLDAYSAIMTCGSALVCEDVANGGTADGTAAFTNDGTRSVMEFSHPLASGDALDFQLAPGDTVGFLSTLRVFEFPSGLARTDFPTAWGHIVIADPISAPPVIDPDTGVSAGLNFSCGIERASKTAQCWGENSLGALGNKTRTNSNVPVPVFSTFQYAAISAGSAAPGVASGHACALTVNGEAHCWGNDSHGQLGNGGTVPIDTATPVITPERFRSISAGREFNCAVTIDRRGFCWGNNGSGQLGNGTVASSFFPVEVSGNHRWWRISAGDQHTCGTTIGPLVAVYCWGNNSAGQLGIGTTGAPRLVPQQITVGIGSFHISAGPEHTCALDLGGTAYCWGANESGQLGDGTFTHRPSPTLVGASFPFSQIDVGGVPAVSGISGSSGHTCGVNRLSSQVYCWGSNNQGQLGTSPFTPVTFPNLLFGVPAVRAVSAGVTHTCAVTTSNETYCWGSNGSGEVGSGSPAAVVTAAALVSGGHLWY